MVIRSLELSTINYASEYFLKRNNLLSNAGWLIASLWFSLVKVLEKFGGWNWLHCSIAFSWCYQLPLMNAAKARISENSYWGSRNLIQILMFCRRQNNGHSKVSTIWLPEPVNMCFYMARGALQMWLGPGIMNWEDNPGLFGWKHSHHMSPWK